MNPYYLLLGLLIGIIASIPMGPVAIIVIQRTLSVNRKSGFISGAGAASIDIIYAILAFFSLSLVVSFIESNMFYVKLIGGIAITFAGLKIFLTNTVAQLKRSRRGEAVNYKTDFFSVMLLTLANPAFILVFVGYFALFGINRDALSLSSSYLLLSGILSGCMLWWFSLSFIINIFRDKIRARHLLWINKIAGSVIVILGIGTVLLMFVDTQVNGIF